MYSTPSMKEFPHVVLSHIISLAGFQTRLVLQRVSWDLRNFIEGIHFESHLKSISITVTLDFISICIDPQNDWSLDVEYQDDEPNGCSVQNGMKPKVLLRDQYFITIFLNDLKINLKNQKSVLELFRLSFECVLAGFLRGISEVLDNRDSPLRVEELNLEVTNQEEVMSILPYIDSKSIRKLFISSSQNCINLEIDQVVRLEQWKSAKELEMYNCIISAPLKDFCHFTNAKIQIEIVCSDDLLMLKEAFLSSSNFQKLILKYIYFDENVDLQLLFGEPDIDGRDTWSFPYPGSDESLRLVHYDNRLGKQVLIASLMLIAFNYAANTYNAKTNELVLEMSKREGTNCGKVTQKDKLKPLEVVYARVLTVSGAGSDLTITKNVACSRIIEKNERAHRFSCQESLDFNNAYLLLAVRSNGEMLSSQIEYRYQEKHMKMFEKKLTTAEVLKKESFQPDTHISINKIVSSDFEQSGPDNNCIKEETYPDNLIGDHGLYVTKLVNGNSAKATTWTRIYFDPDSVGEHLIVPV